MTTTTDMLNKTITEITGLSHPALLTVAQFAQILGISGITVRRMIERGDVADVKIPGTIAKRIPITEIYRIFGHGEAGKPLA